MGRTPSVFSRQTVSLRSIDCCRRFPTMEQQLIDEFAANNFLLDDPSVAKQCASLCASFDLSPADLVAKWELFYLNLSLEGGKVSHNQLDSFCQFIQREQREAFRRQKHSDFHLYSRDDVDMLLQEAEDFDHQSTPAKPSKRNANNGSGMEVDEMVQALKTPGSVGKSSSKLKTNQDSPATPFNQRSKKLNVQFVLNKDLPEALSTRPLESISEDDVLQRLPPVERLDLQILSGGLKSGCRYMFDRTEIRFNAIEKRIKRFGDALAESEGVPIDNQVFLASQDQTFVVGMVCCDGEGHLNDKSVLLQGSVEYSNGHRVRLDLNSIEHYSLFPGQIIGVEGHNLSGHCLVATRIVDSLPMCVNDDAFGIEVPEAKRQEIDSNISMDTDIRSRKLSTSVIVAAGPFTTSDNLAYEPLVELLNYARKKQPNLIVLMGPFVDSDHPQIKLGSVDRTFDQIFQEEIRTRIEDFSEEMGQGARVILIPSVRDAHHDFIFPQPPFDGANFSDPEHQITLLGNPSLFCLNELMFGCCTMDVLRHLSSEETARIPVGESTDRLARLASHVISQRSFYPIFPAPVGVPLDLSLADEPLSMPIQPDVLITPSDLSPFVKVLGPSQCLAQSSQLNEKTIKRTISINPGRLAKGMYGGTFSEIFSIPVLNGRKGQWPEQAKVSIIKL